MKLNTRPLLIIVFGVNIHNSPLVFLTRVYNQYVRKLSITFQIVFWHLLKQQLALSPLVNQNINLRKTIKVK